MGQRRGESREQYLARRAAYRARPDVKAKSLVYFNDPAYKRHRRRFYQDNKDKIRDLAFQKAYGLTLAQVDALIAEQKGRCAICREKPKGKGHCGRLHLDHCHRTGKRRKMLCSNCNVALGLFRDSPILLAAAIKYLKGT